jgi:hypothetical protein
MNVHKLKQVCIDICSRGIPSHSKSDDAAFFVGVMAGVMIDKRGCPFHEYGEFLFDQSYLIIIPAGPVSAAVFSDPLMYHLCRAFKDNKRMDRDDPVHINCLLNMTGKAVEYDQISRIILLSPQE